MESVFTFCLSNSLLRDAFHPHSWPPGLGGVNLNAGLQGWTPDPDLANHSGLPLHLHSGPPLHPSHPHPQGERVIRGARDPSEANENQVPGTDGMMGT